jgi:iron-sulfur cluster repair protein YtfE (RIC family)
MQTISDYMTEDHQHCDSLFADTENAVCASDWASADACFADFMGDTLRHFSREEAVLFPEFEALTGMAGGPTQVMRDEHVQMRNALEGMAAAVARRDADAYLGMAETLLMLMRQHNMKEERILYPMIDQAVPETAAMVERLAQVRD